MFRLLWNMAVFHALMVTWTSLTLYSPAMPQPSVRSNGGTTGFGTITLVAGSWFQTVSLTVWKILRPVHDREGRDVGQVDLDQLGVVSLGSRGIGQSGDLI